MLTKDELIEILLGLGVLIIVIGLSILIIYWIGGDMRVYERVCETWTPEQDEIRCDWTGDTGCYNCSWFRQLQNNTEAAR